MLRVFYVLPPARITHDIIEKGEAELSETLTTAIEKLKAQPQFAGILEYAKGVAHLNGHEDLSPSHIAMGAWLALENGLLHGNVLAAHIQLHQTRLNRFMELAGWNKTGAERVSSEVKPSDALKAAMRASAEGSDALMALVNQGLCAIDEVVGNERTAIHEAGHAVISLALRPEVRMSVITIVPKDDSRGHVAFDESNPVFKRPTSREDVVENICVSLAGRVAQVRKFGADAADSGAIADMDNATDLALKAVTFLGMDDEFGPISLDVVAKHMNKLAGNKQGGMPTGYLFDEAQRRVQVLIKDAYKRTQALVDANWEAIEKLAALLLVSRTLTEKELHGVLPALKA